MILEDNKFTREMIYINDNTSFHDVKQKQKQIGYELSGRGDFVHFSSNNLKFNYSGFFIIKKFNSYSSKTLAEFSFHRSSYYVTP